MKFFRRMLLLGSFACLTFLQSGCIHFVYRPVARPIPKNELQPVSAKAPVAVVAIPGDSEERLLAGKWHYTEASFAPVIAKVLRDGLTGMGVSVVDKAEKSIKISVDDVRIESGIFKVPATVLLHVETESGYERVFEGIASSGSTPTRAVNAALSRSVANLLKDTEFIEYLKK
jgi:hypothetical protein